MNDSISDFHILFSRIKYVLLGIKNTSEIIFERTLDFGNKITDLSKSKLNIRLENYVYIAGEYRFVEIIEMPNPQIFKIPSEEALSKNEIDLLMQEEVGKIGIRFEEKNAIYSYRALQPSDFSKIHDLSVEE